MLFRRSKFLIFNYEDRIFSMQKGILKLITIDQFAKHFKINKYELFFLEYTNIVKIDVNLH